MYRCHKCRPGEMTGLMEQVDLKGEDEVVAAMLLIAVGDIDPISLTGQ